MEEAQKQTKKINFFKKIWYSIAKPSKYEEMRELGMGKSILYFFGVVSFLCVFIGIIATILQTSLIEKNIEIPQINASPVVYFIIYFLAYFIIITMVYAIYIIIISLYMWGMTRIIRQYWDFKKSLMNTIYASTLSVIVNVAYMIISYFTHIVISYFDAISVIFIFIYILILVNKEKKLRKINKQI